MAAKTFASCPPTPASVIREFAMMPTALRGERFPAFAPFATKRAPMKGDRPIARRDLGRERGDEGDARHRAGADGRHDEGDGEEQPGNHARVAARQADGAGGHARERSVGFGGREEQRHPEERQEERRGKGGGDAFGPQPRQGEAEQEGERESGDAHVDARREAQRDGDEQREKRGDRRAHGRIARARESLLLAAERADLAPGVERLPAVPAEAASSAPRGPSAARRMSSISVALWSMSAAVARSSSSSEARW